MKTIKIVIIFLLGFISHSISTANNLDQQNLSTQIKIDTLKKSQNLIDTDMIIKSDTIKPIKQSDALEILGISDTSNKSQKPVNATLGTESSSPALDLKIETLNKKIEALDKKLDTINSKLDSLLIKQSKEIPVKKTPVQSGTK